jgi:hypothetical protein
MSSGFITNYSQESDGTFKGILNTLDSSSNTTTIYLSSVDLIKNDWCLTSPNNIDQILIMTNDSKYIYVPSVPFIKSDITTLYESLIDFCIQLYEIGLSTPSSSDIITNGTGIPIPSPNNLPKSLKSASQLALYIYIYFFINNGIDSYTSMNKIISIFDNKSLTLNTNDPNYDEWDKLPSSTPIQTICKILFLIYATCMNYKSYIYILDPNNTLSINLTDSNWKYVGNFFYTIYQLYSYDASNFCVNLTGDIKYITELSSPSSSLYIPECVDCRTTPLNSSTNINTPNSLCIKPSMKIDTTITYTPAQIATMNNTFLSTSCILIIILIIIAALYWYFNKNNESTIKRNNDYFYI